ncbi:MAG: hypothetical protein IPO82_10660 [Betaproteobacteria bacterium]|nr:hypothetical protein [Betaproteobacteria bacterium]
MKSSGFGSGVTGVSRGLSRVGRSLAAVVAAAGLLAGCAGMPGSGTLTRESPVEVRQAAVAARAQERWDAVIQGDFAKAYSYMTEASREVVTLERFKGRLGAVAYRSAKVQGVTCSADACTAEIFVGYDHRRFKGGATRLTETWVLERGQMAYVDPIR